MGTKRRTIEWIYTNPLTKAAGVVLNALVGSVIGSWWVTDLTSGCSGVRWSGWAGSKASVAVAIYVVILIAYSTGLYVYERRLSRWADPQFRKAKLWEDCWPTMTEVMKQRIREGKFERLSDLEQEVTRDA